MPTVLIELPGGSGVVRMNNEQVFLTHDIDNPLSGVRLGRPGYGPVKTWLDDDQCLVGALMPRRAVRAEVVDARGSVIEAAARSGACAAIIAEPNDGQVPVVRCFDADQRLVSWPLPDGCDCNVTTDVEESCPACSSIDYADCTPTTNGRGGDAGLGAPDADGFVVCRVCGFAEPKIRVMRISQRDRLESDAALAAQKRSQRHAVLLRDAAFPVYAADGWHLSADTPIWRDGQLVGLTIAHTRDRRDALAGHQHVLEVSTHVNSGARSEGPSDASFLWRVLEQWAHNRNVGSGSSSRRNASELSDAAITMAFRAANREVQRALMTATRAEELMELNGVPERFLTLSISGKVWVAARQHGEVMIAVAGAGMSASTIRLRELSDRGDLV